MPHSVFDVIGPAMVGPSSSHTAGAARIGLVMRHLLANAPASALIRLHGSFAATGKGHATDRALVGGLLGFQPDDARLPQSLELAPEHGLEIAFEVADLGEDLHENSVCIQAATASGEKREILASSIGGGVIRVVAVDHYATDFACELETTVLWHLDTPGFLAKVTALLACVEVNIAAIRTSRRSRGSHALTVIETDSEPSAPCLTLLAGLAKTECLRFLPRLR